MKEICFIIRIDRINQTKQALADAGFPSVSARKVQGRGKGKVEYLIQSEARDEFEEAHNAEKGPKLFPKRMLTMVVPDDRKEKAVQTIISVNQTGKAGDGRIFVMPILDAIRIRTGESGDIAVDEQNGAGR